MIVCSCNVLSKARVAAAAESLGAAAPMRPVTPGRVFQALGARPQCGNCFANIRRIIADSGVTFTCPEPLASVAVDASEATLLEIDVTFDLASRRA